MRAARSAERFRYGPFEFDPTTGLLECHYELGDHRFTERITVPCSAAGPADPEAALGAARLVHLLAGVSYYKTGAPPLVDLGDHATTPLERRVLGQYYRQGLAEFAYRNELDLADLEVIGPDREARPGQAEPGVPERPLVPFGGGIDSIVTAEAVRRRADPVLFVAHRPGDPFAAIEAAARVSGLPVLAAQRQIDPVLLEADATRFLQGHVPVTGIVSALAVLVAVLNGQDAVIMSNEHSASVPNLVVDGQPINHQWSKSSAFEDGFRAMLAESLPNGPSYFSLLRPYSELWVARQFAGLPEYHRAFRSCNGSFRQDRGARLDRWCARCDKCCFIDLVLAPFMRPEQLAEIFDGTEPLAQPALADRFRTLLGLAAETKPFECVGDLDECRAALAATAGRPDRAGDDLVQLLASELGIPPAAVPPELLRPRGPHHIPDAYAPEALLV
jgi:hypothetical protein